MEKHQRCAHGNALTMAYLQQMYLYPTSFEAALYASKVQLVCPKCGKATRVGNKRVQKTVSGKEKMVGVRVCKKCGAEEI